MFSFGSKTCAGKLKHMYMQIKCIGGTENKGFRNPDTYDWLNLSATRPCPDMCPRSHWFLQHLSGQPALGFPEIWRNLSGLGPGWFPKFHFFGPEWDPGSPAIAGGPVYKRAHGSAKIRSLYRMSKLRTLLASQHETHLCSVWNSHQQRCSNYSLGLGRTCLAWPRTFNNDRIGEEPCVRATYHVV